MSPAHLHLGKSATQWELGKLGEPKMVTGRGAGGNGGDRKGNGQTLRTRDGNWTLGTLGVGGAQERNGYN